MLMSIPVLTALLAESLRDPAAAAARITRFELSRDALWTALALVCTLSVLLVGLLRLGAPEGVGGPAFDLAPLTYAALLFANLVVFAFAIHLTGRAMGGTGSFDGALITVVWMQFVLLCMQMVHAVLALVLPLLAGVFALGATLYALWVLLHFVRELHGFASLGRAGLMVLMAFLGIAVGLTFILTLIGVGVPGDMQNV